MTVSIGFLLSGSGTTLQNLIDRIADGRLDAKVACVISTKPKTGGIERAEAAGIPAYVVSRKKLGGGEEFSNEITRILDEHAPDLVAMGGFLSLWAMPERYDGRVMNIHPALIPLFCGKGFWGRHVHESVLASGMKVSGCTVHFADRRYDNGPTIVQRTVPVYFEDTPDTLHERVFAAECEAYPEAIRLFAEGRLEIVENRVRVLPGKP